MNHKQPCLRCRFVQLTSDPRYIRCKLHNYLKLWFEMGCVDNEFAIALKQLEYADTDASIELITRFAPVLKRASFDTAAKAAKAINDTINDKLIGL